MRQLSARIGRYPHTASLFGEPAVLADDCELVVQLGGTPATTRSMLQTLAFDVCEMPLVNYLVARERGLAATALPVFTTRRFPHGMLIWNKAAGVEAAADLAGKEVGVPYHGNTDVVWVRGLLETAYGVDVDAITWVTTLEEPVPPHHVPENVRQALGADLDAMLLDGRLAGLVQGRGQTIFGDAIGCLEPNLRAAERAWHGRTGIFPTLFTIVVKDAAIAERPDLATALFLAFVRAKERAYERLNAGVVYSADERAAAAVSGFPVQSDRPFLGHDPLRYGIEANRRAIDGLLRFSASQRITRTLPDAEACFLAHDEPAEHTPDADHHSQGRT